MPVVSATGEPYGVLDILGLMQGAMQVTEKVGVRITTTDNASSFDGPGESRTESMCDEMDAKSEVQSAIEPQVEPSKEGSSFKRAPLPPGWWDEASEKIGAEVAKAVSQAHQKVIDQMKLLEERLDGGVIEGGQLPKSRWVGAASLAFAAGVLVGCAAMHTALTRR